MSRSRKIVHEQGGLRSVLFSNEKNIIVLMYIPGRPFPYGVGIHEVRPQEKGDSCQYSPTGFCTNYTPPRLREFIKAVEMAELELQPIMNQLDLVDGNTCPWQKFLVDANAVLEKMAFEY